MDIIRVTDPRKDLAFLLKQLAVGLESGAYDTIEITSDDLVHIGYPPIWIKFTQSPALNLRDRLLKFSRKVELSGTEQETK